MNNIPSFLINVIKLIKFFINCTSRMHSICTILQVECILFVQLYK